MKFANATKPDGEGLTLSEWNLTNRRLELGITGGGDDWHSGAPVVLVEFPTLT